jgi:hypothetical protein
MTTTQHTFEKQVLKDKDLGVLIVRMIMKFPRSSTPLQMDHRVSCREWRLYETEITEGLQKRLVRAWNAAQAQYLMEIGNPFKGETK